MLPLGVTTCVEVADISDMSAEAINAAFGATELDILEYWSPPRDATNCLHLLVQGQDIEECMRQAVADLAQLRRRLGRRAGAGTPVQFFLCTTKGVDVAVKGQPFLATAFSDVDMDVRRHLADDETMQLLADGELAKHLDLANERIKQVLEHVQGDDGVRRMIAEAELADLYNIRGRLLREDQRRA